MKTVLLLMSSLVFISCTSTFPRRAIVGSDFPEARGMSLEKKEYLLPKDFAGEAVLLILAYDQNTQFDVDRWSIGLDQTQTQITAFEVPTIQGMIPGLISGYIDNGMRKGIPQKLWKGVITIYADGKKLQEFTGNENSRNSRIVLLDSKGKVQFFNDEGFSVEGLNLLRAAIRNLPKS